MMSQALTHKERQDSFQQKKLTDVVDMMYKGALIDEMGSRSEIGRVNAETRRIDSERQLTEAMRTSPVEVMGLGKISFTDWQSLPADVREYSYYAFTEKQRDTQPIPYNEWDKQTTDPIKKQYFDLGKEDPEFKAYLESGEGDAKTPPPVTWTTGAKNLSNRFGSEDATGKWVITEGLQEQHKSAQKFLVDIKEEGKVKPLRAVTEAEDYARAGFEDLDDARLVEENYFTRISQAGDNQEMVDKIKSDFYAQFKYIPRKKR